MKYVSPTIELMTLSSADVITLSLGSNLFGGKVGFWQGEITDDEGEA